MVSFPGFFGDPSYDEQDPNNLFSGGFLPGPKTDGAAQDLTTAPDMNLEAPTEQPPPINSFLPPSKEMQGFAPGNTEDIIYNASQKNNVPFDLAMGVANRESHFNPNAVGTSGEQGMFQVMPSTAGDITKDPYYMSPYLTDAARAQQSADVGTQFLGKQLDTFGNQNDALAAYNAGPGNVSKGIIPSSTKDYVRNVNAYAAKVPDVLPDSALTADSRVPGATATDVGGSAPVSQRPDVAAVPTTSTNNGTNAGEDVRQSTIDKLLGQSSDYEKKALDARKASLAPDSVSKGQMFANVGVPLLASIIGGALRGKKGAMLGAGAGFTGDAAGMATEATQAGNKQKLAAEEAKYYDTSAQNTRNKAIDLQKQGFGADDKIALKQQFGQMGIVNPQVQSLLAKASDGEQLSLDERNAVFSLGGNKAQTLLAQYDKLNGLQNRHVDNLAIRKKGQEIQTSMYDLNTKPVNVYTPIPGTSGHLSKDMVKNVNAAAQGAPQILVAADQLEKILGGQDQFDPASITGEQRQLLGNILAGMRIFQNEGVRFTDQMKHLDEQQLGGLIFSEAPIDTVIQSLSGANVGDLVHRFGAHILDQMAEKAPGFYIDPEEISKAYGNPAIGKAFNNFMDASIASQNTSYQDALKARQVANQGTAGNTVSAPPSNQGQKVMQFTSKSTGVTSNYYVDANGKPIGKAP